MVGFGSVGHRHARLLADRGCQVSVVSSLPTDAFQRYATLEAAVIEAAADVVVIANRTSEHYPAVRQLAALHFRGKVLVEKPIFDRVQPLPEHDFAINAVGYNLRFHPVLVRLRQFLGAQDRLLTAHVYAGQYLPSWRPGTDYRQGYSALRSQGGGVIRDLSHELDYVRWLFGPWRRLTAAGGRVSDLDIDSDDAYSLLMETARCPIVSIHLNYLDRKPRREIIVNTMQHTMRADLSNSAFEVDGEREVFAVDRDQTYRAEHEALLTDDRTSLCDFDNALAVLHTVERAEQAATNKVWVVP